MKKKTNNLRIALICNNLVRELGTLNLLKNDLERRLHAEVKIIGSLAEIQRIYYSLYKFQPHIVFLSQLQEKCCRDFAQYIKASGGAVFVMPEEITPAKVVESLILSPNQTYDHLVDGVFLPGQVMKDFFCRTDVKLNKLKITGSPKIDVEVKQKGINRAEFCRRFKIDVLKKNVFIFPSFPKTDMEYFKGDECFSGNMKLISGIQRVIRDTQRAYLANIPKICALLSEYNIILKPHPLEDLSPYQQISSDNLKIVSHVSTLDCVDSIDLAVHWNSTVSTTCWMHGIPTIQYSPIKRHDWLLSDFTLGNHLTSDYRELSLLISRYLEGKRPISKNYLNFQKKYFVKNFYKTDGKSTERIGISIEKFVLNHRLDVDYKPRFSVAMYLMEIMDKVLGVRVSRRWISIIFGGYNWRYAADNYLP